MSFVLLSCGLHFPHSLLDFYHGGTIAKIILGIEAKIIRNV